MLLNVNVAGTKEAKRNLRKSYDVEIRAGVAEPGQKERLEAQGSGPCPVGVRGFESHPPHHSC